MEDDPQLLAQFVKHNSQDAFTRLVEKHQNWLYSACLRRLRDPALAEDAVQTVFLALMRKAPSLLNQPTLTPWLFSAARYSTANLARATKRRAHHEQQAAAMTPKITQPTDSPWNQIEADLEPALDRLRPQDRQAILLRFFEQKDHAQTAALLGISQQALYKRLSRAIDRLRTLLSANMKSAAPLSAVTLSHLLTQNAVSPAPLSLSQSLASPSTSNLPPHLATATKDLLQKMSWLKIKALLIAIILCAAIAPTAIIIHHHLQSPQSASPTQTATASVPTPTTNQPVSPADQSIFPWKFPNAEFIHNQNNQSTSTTTLDPTTKRTPNSEPAAHLHSNAPTAVITSLDHDPIPADKVAGQHIVITAFIKTQNVQDPGSIQFLVNTGKKAVTIHTDPRPIQGTTDWQPYSIVMDIPEDATDLKLLCYLTGPGDLWLDSFQIDTMPQAFPQTGNTQQWRFWGPASAKYSTTTDLTTTHNAHPTMCISSTTARPSDWIGLDQLETTLQKFQGHKVRVRAWLKLENIPVAAGIAISTTDQHNQTLVRIDVPAPGTPHGTADWKQYSTELSIPQSAKYLLWGFKLKGPGKIWIDLNDATCELADDDHGL